MTGQRVAPYAVEVIDASPAEVDAVARAVSAAYDDAPVVVRYRTSDRVVRNRLTAFTLALVVAALLGLNGPLWAAMPWAVAP
ncbi:MAG: hypothetical protein AB7G36_10035 [Candidatus Nanopelagicales bacterium]